MRPGGVTHTDSEFASVLAFDERKITEALRERSRSVLGTTPQFFELRSHDGQYGNIDVTKNTRICLL